MVAWQVEWAMSEFRLALSFASASRGSVKKRNKILPALGDK
jgi:hypothetical protein